MTTRPQICSLQAAAAVAAVLWAFHARPVAQAPALPYDLHMSDAQLEALTRAWNERLPYIPGEVLVRFRDGVGRGGQLRALSALRSDVEPRNSRWIGEVLWLRSEDEENAERLAETLARQPEVLWAQPNHWLPLKTTPNDPSYSARQWNFDLIDMPRAWDINAGATEQITVAVLDTGITTTTETFVFPLWTGRAIEQVPVPFRVNPDLSAARILPGRDFAFWTGPVLDMVGHGTHVAGTVLQETNNNLALAGIAYRAKLLPLKVCIGYWELQIARSSRGLPGYVNPNNQGGCFDSAITEAIRFAADNGAQMLNLSLGGDEAAPAQLEALRYAVGRGVFGAIAAGNEFEEGNPVEYPAKYAEELAGMMAVGAVGRNSRRAFYSNTGSFVEIAAPGGDFRDAGISGVIYQTSLNEDDSDAFTIIRPRFDRYTEEPKQGTSMAAPHVAGVAALLYSQGINKPEAIEAALKRFARDLGAAGRDDDFGHGLVDARAALRGLGVAK